MAPDETKPGSWPGSLWLVRHGESAGNVARWEAEEAVLERIAIAGRDADVPLSPLGERQSAALGRWFGGLPDAERPTVIFVSPYRRALQTVERLVAAAGASLAGRPVIIDERLREKEFGALNRLTRAGIRTQFPEQALLREQLGKFYYRPPSGESWCDVILRLRSVADQIQLQYAGERVLIVAHQVIVLCFRYLLERMTEAQILEIDRQADVANCAVTSYQRVASGGGSAEMVLRLYNFVVPVEAAGEPVTSAPDTPVAPR
jgi:broad specificity phosphatase PhoE